MKHRKGGEQPAKIEEEEGKAEVVSKEAKKEKKKEKKEIQGLGSQQVNLQLPIYGLAVRHVDFEEVEANEKGKSKDGKKETKGAALPLSVIVGGGGGPGNTGIENKVALFEFKDGGFHLHALADMGECAIMNLAVHPETDFLENKEESDQKAVLFTPNGKVLVTAGVDGAVRLWDWPTLKEKAALMPASPKEIASMHISPDGLLLATVTGQPGDVCRIWQLPKDGKPKEQQTITPPGSDKTLCFRDCKFSPDGQHLYTIQTKSRSDSYLTKWSTKKWQDGQYVATGSGEGELAIFRTSDMKWIHRKRVHDFFVSKVAFAPDSSYVFSTSGDYSLVATAVQTSRGVMSLYGRELFVTFAVLVALLAIFIQYFVR
ncbi:WD domain, G-beta repeat-containing protein [Acanthamoeba castellanii str. Neff]|uniref:WD domain, G-beta repeat-containing protein n=1 Tax=Acanthamoeba castellanii (strain ATCC 30010 / Neff) TaxID=1257118 RepID=L8HJ65_ACACF|nr:WD domain, G-beta repeat-containing protein [Acanthamoeba castellanii str. Neff]ELR25230.1 WD domain, G-beta repeat-containing protein [Acanthamoeba castellanii str. Neff]